MGWTSYPVSWCAYRNGRVDRKAEIDKVYSGEDEHTSWKVLRSAMVSTVWYGAVERKNKDTGESRVFAGVCLTSLSHGEFWYKDMDESVMPYYFDCPKSILGLLTPTEYSSAIEWREKCWQRAKKKAEKSSLGKLPIGTVIEFEIDGKTRRFRKHAPGYQFKTAFWVNDYMEYISKKRIPENYRVVEVVA